MPSTSPSRLTMPLDYRQAKAYLEAGRDCFSRPLGRARNTRLVLLSGDKIGISYHHTNMVTLDPSGAVTLDSGGWQTATTKKRINSFARGLNGFRGVYQHRHHWYLQVGDRHYIWVDGTTIATCGHVSNRLGGPSHPLPTPPK